MELFGVVSILAAVLLLAPKISSKAKKTMSTTDKGIGKTGIQARNPWRAFSIVHDHPACEAVKAINNKRFLDTDKKLLLPLRDCDASTCSCKYVFHEDRREYDEDRRHPASLKSKLYDETGETNRRYKKRGRRKSDWS
jgi:hypothetical protein